MTTFSKPSDDAATDGVENEKGRNSTHFLQLVRQTVELNKDKTFASWYGNDGQLVVKHSFGEIWEEAGKVAHYLRHEWNVKKGQHVLLCYSPGLHFFVSFVGCLRSGVTAVLVYPPALPLIKSLTKLAKVVKDCDPVLILTDTRVNRYKMLDSNNPLSKSRSFWPSNIVFKVTDKLSSKGVTPFDEETVPSDLAFLQYTSGSTGEPKGVMITFAALAADVDLLRSFYEKNMPKEIIGFSWLPQYHDLGLVLGFITPFVSGWRMHMMSPLSFIQNPLLWLELMSLCKVQWSIAPDFAFRLVVRKFREAQKKAEDSNPLPSLDLSCLMALTSAAEPARPETYDEFTKLFRAYGLREQWYSSAYGLAENVVGVSYVLGFVLSEARGEDRSKRYVACGSRSTFDPSVMLKIVDPETNTKIPDGQTGELWISGPTVALGYYGKLALSNETFKAKLNGERSDISFLRTGDLAFIQNDYLFICGRIKDMIIYNGVNYYPQDIEFVVQEASSAVRPGCVAAFTSEEIFSEDSLEIVFEIRKGSETEAEAICAKVRGEVIREIGLPVDRVVAIPERTIPKTTSGKIQRRACRALLHRAELKIVYSLEIDLIRKLEVYSESCFFSCELKVSDDDDDSFSVRHGTHRKQGKLDLGKNAPKSNPCLFNDILCQVLEQSFDPELTWDELGLSSMASVELRESLAQAFQVALMANCFERFKTPRELEQYISQNQGHAIPTKKKKLRQFPTFPVPWSTLGCLQFFGIATVLLLFSASIVPAWYVGKYLVGNDSLTRNFTIGDQWVRWAWFPLVVPTFMVSYSVTVILIKWLVIGRYEEGKLRSPSLLFIRWWFVDRLMELWELWIGIYIKDTLLLWLFYSMLGARIHPSAELKAFLREPDLVKIDKGTTLDHQYPIRCRQFMQWRENEGPTMIFRMIEIGANSTVRGMLSPGVTLGEGAYIERRSVIEEGGQVPAGTYATGNPAFCTKNAACAAGRSIRPDWRILGLFKLVWLLCELYIFFAILLVGQLFLNDLSQTDWRYNKLCYWFLQITFFGVVSPVTSILLKWILIGKRKAGHYSQTLWRFLADWVADYHFDIVHQLLFTVAAYTPFSKGLLKLHGFDIDWSSKVELINFPPSKVDLISFQNSFATLGSFETSKNGIYHQTKIINSSLGWNVDVGPGVKLSNTIVSPLSRVVEDIHDKQSKNRTMSTEVVSYEIKAGLYSFLAVIAIGISLIPVFELWTLLSPSTVFVSVPVLALALFCQTLVWLIMYWFIQKIALDSVKTRIDATQRALYITNLNICWALQARTFLPVLWGTPLFSFVTSALGSKVKGRFLFFGNRTYDFPFITVDDRTISDYAQLNGHQKVYDEITIGPCNLHGTLHEATFVMPNSATDSDHSGPWKTILRVRCAPKLKSISETSTDLQQF